MSGVAVVNQPGVYFVDADGNVVSADDGDTIASHEGLIVAGKDGTTIRFLRVAADGTLRVDVTGTTTQPVSAASLPLPAGAATEATIATLATETKLEAVRSLLATIDADTSSLAAEDFATEAKLEAVRALIETIDVDTGNIHSELQALNTRFGQGATPVADTLQARIQELIDLLGVGATPVADTVQARQQEVIDLLGVGASPTADTLQARVQELIDSLGDAVPSPVADTLQARLQELLDRVGEAIASPAANTLLSRAQGILDRLGDVVASPVANTLLDRLKTLATQQTDGTQRSKITDGTNNASVPASGDTTVSARGIGLLGRTASDLFRFLLVEDSGKLVVASSPPQPPVGSTEFVLGVTPGEETVGNGGDVTSPHNTDSAVVANGHNLFLQSLEAGTEGDPAEAGSVVEWYWVEGAGANQHLIDKFFVDGASQVIPLPDVNKAIDGTVMTGNGTNTFVRVRRVRLSNAAKEIHFVTRGYTEAP